MKTLSQNPCNEKLWRFHYPRHSSRPRSECWPHSVRGWCCIFVQIGCTGAQSCTQAYWLGNLSLPVRETAWARKIQTTGRNPLCLPSSSLTKLTKLIFNVEPSTSTSIKFDSGVVKLLAIEAVREIDWVFNLEIWIIYIIMTILSRWNLVSGLIWFLPSLKL